MWFFLLVSTNLEPSLLAMLPELSITHILKGKAIVFIAKAAASPREKP
jgi:hypothetical protein